MIRPDSLNPDYPIVPLGEVVEFLDHLRKPITAKDRVAGSFPYYGANGQQDSVDGYIFDERLILLAEDGGNFGDPERTIAYQVEGKCWVNNHAHVLRPKDNVDIRYLCRHLEKYDVTSQINGATRAKLNKSAALNIKISLPSLKEQRRIAAILDKADAIRRKRQRAIELTETFLRSVFLDMFGDPVTNPKGWEMRKFGELGSIDRGVSKHRPRNDSALLNGIYPLIQTGDVSNSGGYIRKFTATYSEAGLAQSKLWPKNTLCITIAANIAKTGILTFDACFPDSVVGFIPGKHVTIEYIQYWMSFLQKILEDSAPESAQKNINLSILRTLDVPAPPYEKQREFSKIVSNTVIHKAKLESSEKSLLSLSDALAQQAFNGELTQSTTPLEEAISA